MMREKEEKDNVGEKTKEKRERLKELEAKRYIIVRRKRGREKIRKRKRKKYLYVYTSLIIADIIITIISFAIISGGCKKKNYILIQNICNTAKKKFSATS